MSNVDLGEVQAVDLADLKGLDDVIDALEANVVLPLENSQLAEELALKPKRGVLLAGPPGTGKTTIGRALAHRLKSKFFLIDGTVVSGTPDFFGRVHRIFEAAKQNAPGIIFIDDSDVMFESGQDTGLYRYLLTMLDGLEKRERRAHLSHDDRDGRRQPPAGAGALGAHRAVARDAAPRSIGACGDSHGPLRRPAQGDRRPGHRRARGRERRVVGGGPQARREDGKLLFVYDRARKSSTLPATEYFVRAIETVRRNKEHYAAAEARARMRHPMRPPHFDGMGMNLDAAMASLTAMNESLGALSSAPSFVHMMRGVEDPSGG